MTRKEAWALLEELGAVIRRKVTKQTNLVLIGAKPGLNAKRAELAGTKIIGEKEVLTGNLWEI